MKTTRGHSTGEPAAAPQEEDHEEQKRREEVVAPEKADQKSSDVSTLICEDAGEPSHDQHVPAALDPAAAASPPEAEDAAQGGGAETVALNDMSLLKLSLIRLKLPPDTAALLPVVLLERLSGDTLERFSSRDSNTADTQPAPSRSSCTSRPEVQMPRTRSRTRLATAAAASAPQPSHDQHLDAPSDPPPASLPEGEDVEQRREEKSVAGKQRRRDSQPDLVQQEPKKRRHHEAEAVDGPDVEKQKEMQVTKDPSPEKQKESRGEAALPAEAAPPTAPSPSPVVPLLPYRKK